MSLILEIQLNYLLLSTVIVSPASIMVWTVDAEWFQAAICELQFNFLLQRFELPGAFCQPFL